MQFIYCITSLMVMVSIYLYPKGSGRLNGLEWIFYSLFLMLCVTSFESFFLVLIRFPANLGTMSLFNLILLVGIFIYLYHKKEALATSPKKFNHSGKRKQPKSRENTALFQYQSYFYRKKDVWVILLFFLFTLAVSLYFFKIPFNIAYETSDPAQHFSWALDFYKSSTFSYGLMNFHFANLGMLLKIVSPIVPYFYFYNVYVLFDILLLFFFSVFFYFAVRKFVSKTAVWVISILMTMLFTAGYPLDTIVFGFGYFETGLLLVIFITIAMEMFLSQSYDRPFLIVVLFLAFMGLMNSYNLFVPVVYLSAFCCFVKYYKGKIFKRESFLTIFIALILPSILGILFQIILPYFARGSIPASMIAAEGYIYKNLYIDFLFPLPLAITALVFIIRKWENSYTLYSFFTLLAFMAFLFTQMFSGKVSSYYYYKNNYFLWFLCMYFAMKGISLIFENSKEILYSYLSIWLCLLVTLSTGVEEKIQNINGLIDPPPRSAEVLPVYTFNFSKIYHSADKDTKSKWELYRVVSTRYLEKGKEIPLLSSIYENAMWYNDITEAYPIAVPGYQISQLQAFQDWKTDDRSDYIVCLKEDKNADALKNLSNYRIVFENEAGYIFAK